MVLQPITKNILFGAFESTVDSKESLNDWGGRGCHSFVSALGGDDTKIAPLGDLSDQPSTEMG